MTIEQINKEYSDAYAAKVTFDISRLRPFIPIIAFNLSVIQLECSMEDYMRLGEKAKSDDSEYSYEELSLIINAYRHLTWAMCDLGAASKYPEAIGIFMEASELWNKDMQPAIDRRNKLLNIYQEKLTHNGKGL